MRQDEIFAASDAQLFVATELYQPVGMLTSHGLELDGAVPDERRAGVTLLRKRAKT